MSRRDAGAAGPSARHARSRLQASLGGRKGLLADSGGEQDFEYRGSEEPLPDTAGVEGGPAGLAPVLRWRLGLRAAVLLGVLAIAAGAVFWWQTASGRPQILPLAGISAGPATESGPRDGDGGGAGEDGDGLPAATEPPGCSACPVVVHIAGAVAAPGVVTLPAGSRVHDAIGAAGGGTADADLNRLNLAMVIEDGQKIHVPRQGEAMPPVPESAGAPDAAGGAGGGPESGGAKVNLNTAGAAELDTLPKVGPVLAQRIVDWRAAHGPFKSVEELDAVDGVGPKMLEALLPLVTV
ncbi:ComEA family DNA-binding protein [Arthrobacter sp. SD76]|uniref:ComEA family DNA-binding protein n=1 Tax=Arthrobacter sp. SD76 TaxID=3415007 RepID=UPI003C75C64B